MWLTNSSVGRKFIMAVTGACLVLFVTFHCLMNAVAICWPTAYNSICEFLGANWYALVASAGLAALIIIHIIYAVWLTLQNRKARGSQRYAVERRPKGVEWSSKNMLVLGIVILAFLVIHLIQFWAKMQLQEIRGVDFVLPPAAGTLFIQEAFQTNWTWIVYVIGFVALWFHLNHGFWSMFQSVGWDNQTWICRLRKIGCVWVTVVCGLFLAQAIVFTVKAKNHDYLTNEALRDQYKEMVWPMMEKDFGPDAAQLGAQIEAAPYTEVSAGLRQMLLQYENQIKQYDSEEGKIYMQNNPQAQENYRRFQGATKALNNVVQLFDYIEQFDNQPEVEQFNTPRAK